MRVLTRSIAMVSIVLGLTLSSAGTVQAAPTLPNQVATSTPNTTSAASAKVSHAGPDIYYKGRRAYPRRVQLLFPDGTLLSINTVHRRAFRHGYRLKKQVGDYRARVYYKLRVPVGKKQRRVEVRVWFRDLSEEEAAWHVVIRRLDQPPSSTRYYP